MDLAVSATDFALSLDPANGRIPSEPVMGWLAEHLGDARTEARSLDAIALRVAVLYDAGEIDFA